MNNTQEYIIKMFDEKMEITSSHQTVVIRSLNKGHVYWHVRFHLEEGKVLESESYLLSDAINQIRRELEKDDCLLLIRAADKDITQSGMMGDMLAGCSVAKAEMHKLLNQGKMDLKEAFDKYVFHVLDESDLDSVCRIDEQSMNQHRNS
ncbi:MAG: hypothetical protein AAF740_10035 [Bacteroidota bacterium]